MKRRHTPALAALALTAAAFAGWGDDEAKSGTSAPPSEVVFELKPAGKKATMTGPTTVEAGLAKITLRTRTKKGGGLQLIRVEGNHTQEGGVRAG